MQHTYEHLNPSLVWTSRGRRASFCTILAIFAGGCLPLSQEVLDLAPAAVCSHVALGVFYGLYVVHSIRLEKQGRLGARVHACVTVRLCSNAHFLRPPFKLWSLEDIVMNIIIIM